MAAQGLSKRMAKVEIGARQRWLARPESRCPRLWTQRFLATEPAAAPIVSYAEALVPTLAPYGFRQNPRPLHIGQVSSLVVQRSGAYLVKDHANWKPEGEQLIAWNHYVRLVSLAKEYTQRTGDGPPGGSVFTDGTVWR